MTPTALNAALNRLGLSEEDLTNLMIELGDPRTYPTLLRSIQNWARGRHRLPGEMHVVLALLSQRTGARLQQRPLPERNVLGV